MAKKKVATLEYKQPEETHDYDAKFFSGLISMQNVHPLICSVAQKLDKQGLIEFKKQLLKHSCLAQLPKQLDSYLDSVIAEHKEEQEAKFEVTEPKNTQTWPGLEQ